MQVTFRKRFELQNLALSRITCLSKISSDQFNMRLYNLFAIDAIHHPAFEFRTNVASVAALPNYWNQLVERYGRFFTLLVELMGLRMNVITVRHAIS